MEWINIKEKLPERSGWYQIKTTMGEYEAPYAKTLEGKMIWVVPDEKMITHWKPNSSNPPKIFFNNI